MTLSNSCYLKLIYRGLGAFVVFSLLIPPVSLSAASAQVGPQPPRQPAKRESNVSKLFSKMLKPKSEEGAKEKKAETPGSEDEQMEDSQNKKPKVTAPSAAEEAPVARQPKREPMLSQPPLTNAKIEPAEVDAENPPIIEHPRLDDPSNPLGLMDAQNRLKKYITLVDAQRHHEAKGGLTQLRQWLVDLTEAHIGLYKVLNQVPSARAQAELEKELALQFAQLRDRSMMEMARVYISEKEYSKAVKELTEVVKSQPKSRVGLRSYELLQEIGFTEKLQLTD